MRFILDILDKTSDVCDGRLAVRRPTVSKLQGVHSAFESGYRSREQRRLARVFQHWAGTEQFCKIKWLAGPQSMACRNRRVQRRISRLLVRRPSLFHPFAVQPVIPPSVIRRLGLEGNYFHSSLWHSVYRRTSSRIRFLLSVALSTLTKNSILFLDHRMRRGYARYALLTPVWVC